MKQPLRPMRFDPAYRWSLIHSDIKDGFAREMFHLDTAIWDAEMDMERGERHGRDMD